MVELILSLLLHRIGVSLNRYNYTTDNSNSTITSATVPAAPSPRPRFRPPLLLLLLLSLFSNMEEFNKTYLVEDEEKRPP